MSTLVIAAIQSAGTTEGGQQKESLENSRMCGKDFGLTCVSQMEQDGARREAKVGDVGAELKPLQRRGGIKHNVSFRPLQEDKRAKIFVYHLTHNALIHCNNDHYSALKMPGEKKKHTIAFVISN